MLTAEPNPAAVAAYAKGLAQRLSAQPDDVTKRELVTHLIELTRQVEELAEHLSSSASRR